MSATPSLELPHIMPAQAQKHVTHNEALERLDALAQSSAQGRASAPPSLPAEGECWLVDASPTGAFAGRENAIARFRDGAWQFLAPRAGWRLWLEDETLLVINKPAGLVVHPGSGNWNGTLMNALLHHVPGIEAIPRAGIVHRLDKDTSGLLVVAKTLEAQTDLVRQLQARTVRRVYLAVAAGAMKSGGGVDSPIGRHPVQRIKMAVVPESRGSKPALTWFRIMESFPYCTFVECSLETGRTHQIRVHLASIGHPLLGDTVYGAGFKTKATQLGPRARAALEALGRQALHAYLLAVEHPSQGTNLEFRSELPDDLRCLRHSLAAQGTAA